MEHLSTNSEISSPRMTRAVMRQFGITAKKSLGQNFLVDQNILRKIVDAAELTRDKGALEIGPGLGSLTAQLAKTANKVVSIEIDRQMIPALATTLSAYDNVHIVHGDVLKQDLKQLMSEHFAANQPVSVVANLPYYITTPIIMKLLEEKLPVENIVVMIQKEVAERFSAAPGSKQYGSLSVAILYYTEPEMIMTVPHTVFIPQPNVESAIIKLRMRKHPPVQVQDEKLFFDVVRMSFAQRRKTIANNLLHSSLFHAAEHAKERVQSVLQEAGIEANRRAETLSIEEFARISNVMSEQN